MYSPGPMGHRRFQQRKSKIARKKTRKLMGEAKNVALRWWSWIMTFLPISRTSNQKHDCENDFRLKIAVFSCAHRQVCWFVCSHVLRHEFKWFVRWEEIGEKLISILKKNKRNSLLTFNFMEEFVCADGPETSSIVWRLNIWRAKWKNEKNGAASVIKPFHQSASSEFLFGWQIEKFNEIFRFITSWIFKSNIKLLFEQIWTI